MYTLAMMCGINFVPTDREVILDTPNAGLQDVVVHLTRPT